MTLKKASQPYLRKNQCGQHRQRGITLIELMVSMVIGLFMVAGILQVFVGSRQSLDVIRAQSSMQEA
ncbi:MAG: prepilin-type N-terminal cleavage/methylation domain-containing protein, partial [Pseudomonadales bacterium]